jgi:5-methylcytosine-specific restriction endonuclease McrA
MKKDNIKKIINSLSSEQIYNILFSNNKCIKLFSIENVIHNNVNYICFFVYNCINSYYVWVDRLSIYMKHNLFNPIVPLNSNFTVCRQLLRKKKAVKITTDFMRNVIRKNKIKQIDYRRKIPKIIKTLVWNTYIGDSFGKYKCLCCKKHIITQLDFHCAHIVSRKYGGKTNVDNLRPVCAQCNLSMATMNMNTFMNLFF